MHEVHNPDFVGGIGTQCTAVQSHRLHGVHTKRPQMQAGRKFRGVSERRPTSHTVTTAAGARHSINGFIRSVRAHSCLLMQKREAVT